MDATALITLWQLAGVVLPIVGAVIGVSFLIFCAVGYVLWFTRRGLGEDAALETDPEWLESQWAGTAAGPGSTPRMRA